MKNVIDGAQHEPPVTRRQAFRAYLIDGTKGRKNFISTRPQRLEKAQFGKINASKYKEIQALLFAFT